MGYLFFWAIWNETSEEWYSDIEFFGTPILFNVREEAREYKKGLEEFGIKDDLRVKKIKIEEIKEGNESIKEIFVKNHLRVKKYKNKK